MDGWMGAWMVRGWMGGWMGKRGGEGKASARLGVCVILVAAVVH